MCECLGFVGHVLLCSTKGNLDRHREKMHTKNPPGKSSGENASKYIYFDEDTPNDAPNSDEDDGPTDPMQSL